MVFRPRREIVGTVKTLKIGQSAAKLPTLAMQEEEEGSETRWVSVISEGLATPR